MQNQVTIYSSVYTSLDLIPTESQQLAYLKAVLAYAFEGKEPDFGEDKMLAFGFAQVKPNLDSSRRKAQAARENGAKGGRPRKEKTQGKPSREPISDSDKPTDKSRKPTDIKREEIEREGYYKNNNPSLTAEPCVAVADMTAPQTQRIPTGFVSTPPPPNVVAMVRGMR